jgi:hypothetical protein
MTLRVIVGAMLLTGVTTTAQTQDLAADLQRAMQREVASGECKVVLADYARIAERGAKTNRTVAAEALLRAAICHETIGDGLAAGLYARIVNDFRDRPPSSEAARRLDALQKQESSTRSIDNGRRHVAFENGQLSPDGRFLAFRKDFDLVVKELASGKTTEAVVHPSESEGVCTDGARPWCGPQIADG